LNGGHPVERVGLRLVIGYKRVRGTVALALALLLAVAGLSDGGQFLRTLALTLREHFMGKWSVHLADLLGRDGEDLKQHVLHRRGEGLLGGLVARVRAFAFDNGVEVIPGRAVEAVPDPQAHHPQRAALASLPIRVPALLDEGDEEHAVLAQDRVQGVQRVVDAPERIPAHPLGGRAAFAHCGQVPQHPPHQDVDGVCADSRGAGGDQWRGAVRTHPGDLSYGHSSTIRRSLHDAPLSLVPSG